MQWRYLPGVLILEMNLHCAIMKFDVLVMGLCLFEQLQIGVSSILGRVKLCQFLTTSTAVDMSSEIIAMGAKIDTDHIIIPEYFRVSIHRFFGDEGDVWFSQSW